MQNTIKSSGKMTTTINHRNYIDLLDRVEIVPKVIETESEYDRFLTVVEGLLSKRQNRTPEETALLVLLVKLVEDYEREHIVTFLAIIDLGVPIVAEIGSGANWMDAK
jgi:rRNA pseudouridine-1189 N-methylase Emg1 (Nep1/Mra1 family)